MSRCTRYKDGFQPRPERSFCGNSRRPAHVISQLERPRGLIYDTGTMQADFPDYNYGGPLFIHEETRNEEIVHVIGDLDFSSVTELEATIVRSVRIGRTLVVDLSDCRYLEAAALGVFARARRALGKRFHLVIPESGIVRRVFDITGFSCCDLAPERSPRGKAATSAGQMLP